MQVNRHGNPFLIALVRSLRAVQALRRSSRVGMLRKVGQRRGGELSCEVVCNVVFATYRRIPNKCGLAFGEETRVALRLRAVGRVAARAQKCQAIGPTFAPLLANGVRLTCFVAMSAAERGSLPTKGHDMKNSRSLTIKVLGTATFALALITRTALAVESKTENGRDPSSRGAPVNRSVLA